MIDNKKIIWLASYPKSGNTWFRVFLCNLFSDSPEPANINDLKNINIASSRLLFDRYSGVKSSDLTLDEIDNLRPQVYKLYAEDNQEPTFMKVHDAWTINNLGKPIFPIDITKGVLYIVRNPLDISVSFADHNNISFDQSLKVMCNDKYALSEKAEKLHYQLRQKLLSWSNHVKSWVLDSGTPVHVIRYEDMLTNPINAFTNALNAFNISFSRNKISASISKCEFKLLQSQEKESGFIEKPINSSLFFRAGQANKWEAHLKKKDVKLFIKYNKEIMKRYGYI